MSKTIDERIVEMRFDNKQFESNVQTSMSTLEKLKQSLNLTGAAKGLENVNAAAKNCNMSGLSNAVETVRVKFSALQVIAMTALANITNSALNAGKNIVSALTLDPIKTGFEEYELKMNSIQTIMSNTASKGTTMRDVTRVLDELNTYADKTIYNFAEMTRNIGTFTAAGVGLETSATAIQGIANLAAASGSSSQQASTAMYQLSQAIAAGTVKLMDWNSVVNAGMGGEKFQEALKETARRHGVAVDQMIEKNGSFRDSLQEGWLSAEILTETLNNFTVKGATEYAKSMQESGKWTKEQAQAFVDEAQAMEDAATKVKTFTQLWDTLKESAQSGWSQSWEIIVGDFEEAKALFTEISDTLGGMINASADARNKVLQGWKDLGGRTAIIDALRNTFEGVLSIITPVKEAFREIFPPITAKQLVAFSEGLRDLTSHLKLSDTTSANLKSTFKGLFAVIDIGKQAFSAILKTVASVLNSFSDLGGGVLSVTAYFGECLVKVDDFIKKTDIFNKASQGIVMLVGAIKTAIKSFVQVIAEKFNFSGFELFHVFLERIDGRMSQVGEAAGGMKSTVVSAIQAMGTALANSSFLQMLRSLWEGIKTIANGIITVLSDMVSSVIEKLGNANFSGIFDIISGLSLGGIALAISKFLKSITEPLEGLQGVIDGVTSILDGVRGCFEAYQTQLKAGTLLKIAGAIGVLAASIVAISLIDSDKLNSSLGAITVMFADLMAAMAVFSKISGPIKGAVTTPAVMLAMATSVLVLASALKKIGDLDIGQIATGVVGIAGLTTIMVAAAKAMSSGSKIIVKGASGMVIFAAAIKVLASVCKDLSELNWDELGRGLVGVGVLMAEVAVFLNTAKFSGKSISTAAGIIVLASAIKILGDACEGFGQMKWEEIGKGLVSIGALLLEISAFTNLTGNAQHVISTGLALVEIGAAMKIFASSMSDFGQMKWGEIGKGLVSMGAALAEVAVAANLMPKNMVSIGTGLVVVGGALEIMADVLAKMGKFSWEQIAKGLIVLGGALAELAIGLNFMTGTLAGSAAMLVAAGALAVLTPVLLMLGSMSWGSIAKGLITIAGAFTIIGTAGLLLTPLVPTIIALAGAFTLIGVGVLGVGAGLLAAGTGLVSLAAGFASLAAIGVAGATSVVASLTVIVTGVANLIPMVIAKIGEGIVSFCNVIAESAPAIAEAVKAVVLNLVDVIVECAPKIADGALQLITEVLKSLANYAPQITDAFLKLLIGVINSIADNLPTLIQAAMNVIGAFFSGIIDALSGIDVSVLVKGIAGIGLLSAMMVALSAVASLVPGAMVGVLGMGAVVAELALVLAAVGALAQLPGLNWLIGEGGKLLQNVGTAIGSFVGGIVGGFMSGISSQFPQIGSDLSAFMTNIQPFIESSRNIDSSVFDGVSTMAKVILLLTAADILQGLTSWLTGGSSLSKFGAELAEFGPSFKSYYESVKGIDGSVVEASANAAKALSEMANNLPNSGGIVSWFVGDNSLSVFGEELSKFGPKLKSYSDSVQGLDANVVVNSANAAMALAELANNLPNQGGIVSWFTGDNSLSAFADELSEFGPVLKRYADSVRGLDPNVIVNSANAAKALSEMANNLPNQGGAVSWFTGDNKLSVFGEELATFGPTLKKYSDSIQGIDPAVVTNSANAAKALAELANNLPNTGGLVSWFTGDNSMASFGQNLVSFGQNFSRYSNLVSGIDTSQLSSVIAETNKLVSMAKGMTGLDVSGMSSFGTALTALGQAGIDGFINAFANATSRVAQAASDMLTAFINAANAKQSSLTTTFTALIQAVLTAINSKQQQFSTAGQTLMTQFISGIKSKDSSLSSTAVQMVSSVLSKIKGKANEFNNAGQTLMTQLISGIRSKNADLANTFTQNITNVLNSIKGKAQEFNTAGQTLITQFISGIKSKESSVTSAGSQAASKAAAGAKNSYNAFYNAGANLVKGFAAGISANTYIATARARAMAAAAAQAARAALKIKSPSKVFYSIGGYAGLGFVNALSDYGTKAYTAGFEMADSAKNGLNKAVSKIADAVSGDFDYQPTIRPIVDLSDVSKSADEISGLFSSQKTFTLAGKSVELAQMANFKMNSSAINGRESISINNDDVVKAIGELRSDISVLAGTMSKLKVVMDTGTLVGSLTGPLDSALGRQMIYSGRGI